MSQTPSHNPGPRPAADLLGPSKDPVEWVAAVHRLRGMYA